MSNLASVPFELDKSNLRQAIIDSPSQFKVGFDIAKDIRLDGKFTRATFHGEGGSAFPVSLVATIIRDRFEREGKIPLSIYQNHTYSLSPEALDNSLNFFCSYSGNTEETISTLKEAIKNDLPAVVIASGGELEKISSSEKLPFIKLPIPYPAFQPRMGTGYFVAAILQVLMNHDLVFNLRDNVLSKESSLVEVMGGVEEKGLELAKKINGKTPVVWSSQKYKDLARVWTIKFNEHSKNPAFWNFFPELNHNSMVGYTNLGEKYFAIMLKDPDDGPENLRRYEITADILKIYNMDCEILELQGSDSFEKIFKSIYVADFAAYYLADFNKIDPTPVEMVEELKKRLKS